VVQKHLVFFIVYILGFLSLSAQDERAYVRAGNQFFIDSNYAMADSMYRVASGINSESIAAQYNSANSKYKQENYVEAITEYENLIPQLETKDQKSKAFHNLGNSYLKSQKLEEAIEAYKNALRANPKDEKSRYNLAYAKNMMAKKQG
jgi:tetratricopeptide (TPR) repeat protein